ncbi:hypothetical protein [Streptomyces sp. NPDC058667]|uniref:hypothetical protein n=1 Tax=Streptomyces sp. NPDC058667 TaxID=3346588 RepID=UPI0036473BAF
MDWTQLLKELADAVEVRNSRVVALRSAGSHVAELAAQALVAGAPGPPLRRILAGMEPLVERERPHVCGHSPAVPPARPAPPPTPHQPPPAYDDSGLPALVRYSLAEAWHEGILPWKPATARMYRKRSIKRGIPVPEGELDGQTLRYTEDELRTWRATWEKQAAPATAGRLPQGPEVAR